MTTPVEVLMVDGAMKRQGDSLAPQGVVMHCSRIAAMTINNTVDAVIGFDTRDFDPYGWLDTTTGRFTPKIAGYYRMSVNTLWTGVPSNSRWTSHFRKNGTSGVYTRVSDFSWGSAADGGFGGTDLIYFNGTTDYVEFIVWQNSGAARAILAGSPTYNFMSAELVGASVGVIPEPWHVVGSAGEPGFGNSWTHYDTVGQYPVSFYKDPNGRVYLAGLIKSGTSLTASMFTLPAGYRPSKSVIVPSISDDGAGSSVKTRIDVSAAGLVSASQGGTTGWVSLNPVSFRAEQ